ncbi:MAG: gamma carbonic anhydrase family protein [Candidatus Eremiobacteraeota bacterium]|nr:gamma carbonic anhydrase family protein [Candidatus Eremiobacteraeota bacterium]
MILSSNGKKPKVHASAYVAPNAILSGDVTIEEGCAILYGAVITAEGAPAVIGANTVIMENAVLKSSGGSAIQFPLAVGESCIIGPTAYVVGASLDPGVFIAAGAKVFNGATIEEGVSVALGGIVHINTRLPSGTHVPMQHIAYGDPAAIHPPREAPEVHKQINFFETVFNLPYSDDVRAKAAEAYAKFLRKTHAKDATVDQAVAATKPGSPKGAPTGKTREEPPPTQSADVAKVLDVTFMELEEARMRREAALDRERRGKPK